MTSSDTTDQSASSDTGLRGRRPVEVAAPDGASIMDHDPTARDVFMEDVIAGLTAPEKAIPPKYLYDDEGSRIFDEICETADYYPTRTEAEIFDGHIDAMAGCIGQGAVVIEPGAGSGEKAVKLIDALDEPEAIVPVDISMDYVKRSADILAERFPEVAIYAVCADFTKRIPMPAELDGVGPRSMFFPGSTIGNFLPEARRSLMRLFASQVAPDGGALMGVDLRKVPERLEAAYDDSEGKTRAFNFNLLDRMNRELGADFDPDGFKYRAIWDEAESCVWMGLISERDQTVAIGDREIAFVTGERMHTESSYKFELEGFAAEAKTCGMTMHEAWTDKDNDFAVVYLAANA